MDYIVEVKDNAICIMSRPIGKRSERRRFKKLKSEVNVIVVKGLDDDSVAFITCGAKSNFENT